MACGHGNSGPRVGQSSVDRAQDKRLDWNEVDLLQIMMRIDKIESRIARIDEELKTHLERDKLEIDDLK